MGHRFCNSHWDTVPSRALDGNLARYMMENGLCETPCFATVREIYKVKESIRTVIKPSFKGASRYTNDEVFPCRLTPEMTLSYIRDVQTALPGIVRVVSLPEEGPYVFEYPLGSNENYWKFLGVASLMRYVEEFWLWVEEYHDLRQAGIPIDVALFCCNLGKKAGSEFVGHAFSPSLQHLQSWKGFSLEKVFLQNPKIVEDVYHTGLWTLLTCDNPHFNIANAWPSTFPMTREIYELFCTESSDQERANAIGKVLGRVVSTPRHQALAA